MGHRCPTCFGHLLLQLYAVFMFWAVRSEAQSQGTMSGPIRTRAGPYRRHPMAVSLSGSGLGVHVRPYMHRNHRPYETAIVNIMSVHVSFLKLPKGDYHKRQNRCLWVTAKNIKTGGTTVSHMKLLIRTINKRVLPASTGLWRIWMVHVRRTRTRPEM